MAIRNNGNETQSPGCLQVLVLKRVAGPLLWPTDQADEQVPALSGKRRGSWDVIGSHWHTEACGVS